MRRLKSIRDMMFVHLEFKEERFNVTEKKVEIEGKEGFG